MYNTEVNKRIGIAFTVSMTIYGVIGYIFLLLACSDNAVAASAIAFGIVCFLVASSITIFCTYKRLDQKGKKSYAVGVLMVICTLIVPGAIYVSEYEDHSFDVLKKKTIEEVTEGPFITDEEINKDISDSQREEVRREKQFNNIMAVLRKQKDDADRYGILLDLRDRGTIDDKEFETYKELILSDDID